MRNKMFNTDLTDDINYNKRRAINMDRRQHDAIKVFIRTMKTK